eukprot:238921-Chlamydomonas_euryale.AAC.1
MANLSGAQCGILHAMQLGKDAPWSAPHTHHNARLKTACSPLTALTARLTAFTARMDTGRCWRAMALLSCIAPHGSPVTASAQTDRARQHVLGVDRPSRPLSNPA